MHRSRRASLRVVGISALAIAVAAGGAPAQDVQQGALPRRELAGTRDPAWLVRDAALEALFRAAPTDARIAAVIDGALEDSSAEVRERAASIKAAMRGRPVSAAAASSSG